MLPAEEGGQIFRRESILVGKSSSNEDGEMDDAGASNVEETRLFIVTSKE